MQGYYADQGLQVEILGAQEGGTVEQLVATGRLDFGISYQEGVTQARVEGVPIVFIAAIVQHNTSGFASRVEEGITSPRDFIGKKIWGIWFTNRGSGYSWVARVCGCWRSVRPGTVC
jgi:ABC-type nitrate/sulfonate/bicarbonate transport system substrate-binding protein